MDFNNTLTDFIPHLTCQIPACYSDWSRMETERSSETESTRGAILRTIQRIQWIA